ncbi:MAG: hypothetical protein HY553_08915 [Elusimicrobia bacterium]|nr:hypothetical protein [Elusimicrobiota bacterium]
MLHDLRRRPCRGRAGGLVLNAIFVTQALNLRLHHRLMLALRERGELDRVGFYVSDSMFFRRFCEEQRGFPPGGVPILKEWEIMAAAQTADADVHYLRKLEDEMSGPLWDALGCDRRIMLGRWCRERQNYHPRFSHQQMLRILTVALRTIERTFDNVRPDVTLGLGPVTFGEYLFYLVARARGVPTLFVYPTKVKNYVAWMSSFFGRPDHIVEAYEAYERRPTRDRPVEEAEAYVRAAQEREVRHEGMVAIPGKVAVRRGPLGRRLVRFARGQAAYWLSESRHDNQIPGPAQVLYRATGALLRTRRLSAWLARHYVPTADLAGMAYAFYPLHAEPEVALSIQGKPYQNQIETIRNIARSLPVGWKLVTKEHPRCIGYHSRRYYEHLLRIPNVVMADPFVESRAVVDRAQLAVAVWSFVGFEAIVQRRPLILLGTPPFGILPRSMVRHVTDLNTLAMEIRDLLATYEYRERSVVHYVAANLKGGAPLDLYSEHLEKRGRYREPTAASREDQFRAFVDYTLDRIRQVRA